MLCSGDAKHILGEIECRHLMTDESRTFVTSPVPQASSSTLRGSGPIA